MFNRKSIVLIPAFKPEESLLTLIDALHSFDGIVIVDDGSGYEFSNIFESALGKGAVVLTHDCNYGKGHALKTGINYILQNLPGSDVITADADGQHLPEDIAGVRQAMDASPGILIIGARAFDGKIPLRSRIGNIITRGVFSMATGNKVYDTQTGLRGLPSESLAKLLTLPGDRYEFEIEMLLRAADLGIRIIEIPIATVYLNKNSTSHFNTIRDSWRIYKRIILYSASSLLSAGVDVGAFSLLSLLKLALLPSIVIARVISLLVNYCLNSTVVFARKQTKRNLFLYVSLAVVVLALNYLVTLLLSNIVNVYMAKIIANIVIAALSYLFQQYFVFKS